MRQTVPAFISRKRRAVLRPIVAGAFLLAASLAAGSAQAIEIGVEQLAEPGRAVRRAGLIHHGIMPTPEGMIAFIREGFPDSALYRGLPGDPPVKTEVLNYAIQELGFQQAEEAVPLLVSLLQREIPAGIRRVISIDLESVPIEERERFYTVYEKMLILNAIVSLGLIGEPSAADAISQAMNSEEGNAFVTEGAIALGLLRDERGLAPLSRLADDPESDDLEGVFETIYFLTGRNYGLNRHSSIAKRRLLIAEFKKWLYTDGKDFEADRPGILRRRVKGADLFQPPLNSLRGALRASRDAANFDLRYAARERLRQTAPSVVPELRQIVEDPMEDLDIRRAAMQWYAGAVPREAKSVMKNLARKDENEIIREYAQVLLPEIDRVLAE